VPVFVIPIIVVLAVVLSYSINKGRAANFGYRCGSCGHVFAISPLKATFAPHSFGGSKLMRCPSCGAVTWTKPVPNE
jgi:DNA-directed RNA polymerase subunit RPC12/RpoP